MDKEEETVVASLDPNINDVEDFTLPPQRMDIKAEDLIPYLYKGKRWDPRLLSALKGLLSKGFIGISRSFEKIDFFANNEDIILTLVTLIFPLFISPEVGFGKVEELPPPFVPFDFMRPFFIKHMKSELVKHKTTFFYEANCGASLNMKHMRISIAHYKPNMVANWFWKLFTCLNFIQLSRIVINEELGDGIRFKSGVAAEDPKGTVAAYFGKDGSYYALTARHVLESIWKQAEQGFLIDNGDRPIEISRIPEELEYEEIPTTFGANSPKVFVGATCVIDWLGGLQFNLTNN